MEVVAIPNEVYAYVDSEWQRVVGISPTNGWVAITGSKGNRAFPPAEAERWDLLWPR